jgi:glycosyltransferase involved in cell wall biosynthesis
MFKTEDNHGLFFVPHTVNINEPEHDKKNFVFFAGQLTGSQICWPVFGNNMRNNTHSMLSESLQKKYIGILSETDNHHAPEDINLDLLSDRIPFPRYSEIMSQASVCVSPYGFGEICYRHIESMAFGCVCLSPPVGHVRSLYPKEFYDAMVIYTSYEDMLSKADYLLSHPKEARTIGKNGRAVYRQHLLGVSGGLSDYMYSAFIAQVGMALSGS